MNYTTKGTTVDPIILDNFHLVSKLPFLGKVLEKVAVQFQRILEEADYLDCFQSGFRSSYGTEMALRAYLVAFWGASILALLDFLVAFDTINHSVL